MPCRDDCVLAEMRNPIRPRIVALLLTCVGGATLVLELLPADSNGRVFSAAELPERVHDVLEQASARAAGPS